MERDMQELGEILDSMETMQRRAPDARDISDEKNEEVKFEEVVAEDGVEEHFLKVVVKLGAREKIDIQMYEGNLDVEEFIYWIQAMYKYFDYEYVDEEKMVITCCHQVESTCITMVV
jgi:hypothetical protein